MSNSTKRNIVLAAVLMIASIAAFGFMVYQVLGQGEQLNALVANRDRYDAQKDTYNQLQRQAEETLAERQQLEAYFLKNEGASIDFLNAVEGLAPQIGVALETTALTLLIEEDKTKWVKASFKFSGSRAAVQQFIQLLETLPYIQRISSVDVDAKSATEWQADVTMQVRIIE
ncbi:hypothetical protein KC906_00520 [Candidatus Kaiserbacteria bacterium]|nr:hypothetical protein [Candidatus Kaiserbacteria bacterium]MCB9812436.1 hypothetical protein [Candidatus Nomurabacteria bacterium]